MSNVQDENNVMFKIVAIFGSIAVCYLAHVAVLPRFSMIFRNWLNLPACSVWFVDNELKDAFKNLFQNWTSEGFQIKIFTKIYSFNTNQIDNLWNLPDNARTCFYISNHHIRRSSDDKLSNSFKNVVTVSDHLER